MDCTECKKNISALVDGELDQSILLKMNQHLSQCEECQTLIQAEKRVKNLLIESYHPEKAPFALHAGIRQQFAKKSVKVGLFQALFARPIAALMTTLVILLMVTVVYQTYRSGQLSKQLTDNYKTHLHGHIDCISCFLAQTEHTENHCSEYGHYYGLITDTGEIYSFVSNELSNEIQTHSEYAHQDVELTGWVFHQANFIEIENYQIINQTIAINFLYGE